VVVGIVIFALFFALSQSDPALSRDPGDPNTAAAAVAEAMSRSGWASALTQVGSVLAITLSLLVAGRFLDHRSFADFGFHISRRWCLDFGFGLALGAVLMLFIFVVELAAGWLTVTGTRDPSRTGLDFLPAIALALITFICVGFEEEMLSRGYQLRNMAEGLNWRWWNPKVALILGWVLSSSIFGLLHLANPNSSAISTILLIVAGLFLGLGFVLTKELAIPIGLHITWNFFEGNVFGFAVSGLTGMPTFIAIRQGGPDLVTGGVFGPEAGIMGLVAIALGSALIWLWVRWTRGKAELQSDLATYRREARV
jgi:uncharacterized protein